MMDEMDDLDFSYDIRRDPMDGRYVLFLEETELARYDSFGAAMGFIIGEVKARMTELRLSLSGGVTTLEN